MKRAALGYAFAGWRVFPVDGDTKHPRIKSWPTQATSNPEQVERWWSRWPDAAIGSIPWSAGLLAFDYDIKGGKSVLELKAELEVALGCPLPESSMVAGTPSGGEHHYYAVSEELPSGNGRLVRGVDVRCDERGYVVLPPSMSKGRPYRWRICETPDPVPALAAQVLVARQRSSNVSDVRHELRSEPELLATAYRWLASDACKPSIEGEGGNQRLYATACMLIGFGLSLERQEELLHEYNRTKCHPPWEQEDLERVMLNASRYCTWQPGALLPGAGFAPLAETSVAGHAPLIESPAAGLTPLPKTAVASRVQEPFRFTSRDEMARLEPPQWLLEPYLPMGACVLLTGGYSTYKSFIALDMAMTCAAAPRRSYWRLRAKPGPVLYVVGEGRSGMKPRMRAWERYHGVQLDDDAIHFVDPVPYVGASALWDRFVAMALGRHSAYRLVVLDTVGRATAGMNENASETASAMSRMMGVLSERLGACILAVAHTRKDRMTGQGATRGSGVFENDADTVLTAESQSSDRRVALEVVKQRDAQEAPAVCLSLVEEGGSLVVSAQAEPIVSDDRYDKGRLESYLLDKVAQQVIESSPQENWSARALAENVALDDRVELSADTVRKKLQQISQQSEFGLSYMYRPARGQRHAYWRYTPRSKT